MSKSMTFEGTRDEVVRQLNDSEMEGRLRVIVEQIEAIPELPGLPKSGESLADALGDLIGSVKATGYSDASRVSEEFTEYLVEKHREGRL